MNFERGRAKYAPGSAPGTSVGFGRYFFPMSGAALPFDRAELRNQLGVVNSGER